MTIAANQEPERIIATLRPNARRLIGPALLFIVLVGALLWLTGVFQEAWMTWLILIAGAFLLVVGCFIPFLSWLVRRYTITTRKIIVQHGLFVRVRKELLHSRGYEVTVRRTAGQSLFRCGDIRINTTANELPVDLKDVPNPVLVQSVLQDLVEGNAGAAELAYASDRPSGAHRGGTDLIADHGAHTTDATKRFDPTELDDTQAL